jgi:hypothetical protein
MLGTDLVKEVGAMSEQPNDTPGSASDDHEGRSSRSYGRRALILGAAAGAGAAVGLVAGAEPASAADGNPVLIGESNKAKATTKITTTKGDGLQGSTSQDAQSGVAGTDTSSGGGYGLQGFSQNGTGVVGTSTEGSGVSASLTDPSNGSPALQAQTAGTGSAVEASISDASNSSPAVSAQSTGGSVYTGPLQLSASARWGE